MPEVLFVCTGNTCRSPMAEALARAYAAARKEYADIGFFSRGVSASYKTKAAANAVLALLVNYGIDLNGHMSARLTDGDMERASLVLCMAAAHKSLLLIKFPEYNEKVFSIAEASGREDIPDPFGGDLDEYSKCAESIKACIENIDFLKYLAKG